LDLPAASAITAVVEHPGIEVQVAIEIQVAGPTVVVAGVAVQEENDAWMLGKRSSSTDSRAPWTSTKRSAKSGFWRLEGKGSSPRIGVGANRSGSRHELGEDAHGFSHDLGWTAPEAKPKQP
jgi:hypothetical protein